MLVSITTKTKSSFIEGLDYNLDKEELTIWMHGRAYTYFGVSFILFGMMLHAPSVGSFYNRFIKGTYPWKILIDE